MIVPIQTRGTKPPLFMVHGLYGILARTDDMARALGPDQPFYGLLPPGIDGREQPRNSIAGITAIYLREIRSVAPHGPYRLSSICSGAVIAVDLARALAQAGETIDTLLLIDGPTFQIPADQYDPRGRDPQVFQQLYDSAIAVLRTQSGPLVFDVRNSRQLHVAASIGVTMAGLLTAHRPLPYSGPVELIVSRTRAAAYFRPELPWQSILLGPRRIHVLPGNHDSMFHAHLHEVLRLMRFVFDGANKLGLSVADREAGQGTIPKTPDKRLYPADVAGGLR